MKHPVPLRPPAFGRAAFTITELMVAVGILAIGSAVALPLLSGDVGLYARNFSINKSNNSLRYSLQNLKRDLDMSVEPPLLVTASVTGAGVATLTPLTVATPQGAQAMITFVNFGPAYQLPPTVVTNGIPQPRPINPATTIKINRYVATAANVTADPTAVTSPLPRVGDRILFMTPSPYSDGMSEDVTLSTNKPATTGTAGVTVIKPGRLITAVNPSSDPATGVPVSQFTITIDQTNPLPSNASGCLVTDSNSVYFFRESVYVASLVNDSAGKPSERRLLFYRSVADLSNPQVLTRDLDPNPQETDPVTGVVTQPFNFYTRSGSSYPLTVNLPVRALDYSRAIGDRNLGTATAGTSTAEFNLYLRSSTTMNIKGRLDDTSLSQIKAN